MVQSAYLFNCCCTKSRIYIIIPPKMFQSSILTNAVPVGRVHDHPLLHFARDGANFSLNSDDPTVIGTRLAAEYETVRSWGLTEAHLVRAVRQRDRCFAVYTTTLYTYIQLNEFYQGP